MSEREKKRGRQVSEIVYRGGGLVTFVTGLNATENLLTGKPVEALIWTAIGAISFGASRFAAGRRGMPPEIETIGKALMKYGGNTVESTNAMRVTHSFMDALRIPEKLQLTEKQLDLFTTVFSMKVLGTRVEQVESYTAGRTDQMADIIREYAPTDSMSALGQHAHEVLLSMNERDTQGFSPTKFVQTVDKLGNICLALLSEEGLMVGREIVHADVEKISDTTISPIEVEQTVQDMYAFVLPLQKKAKIGAASTAVTELARQFCTVLAQYRNAE